MLRRRNTVRTWRRSDCCLATVLAMMGQSTRLSWDPAVAVAPYPILGMVSHAERALSVALTAAAVDAALWLFLYLRPAPLGAPFALDPAHYVFHGIYYGLWAQLIFALPFMGLATLRTEALRRVSFGVQIALNMLLLLIGAVDRECQRFLGMHASVSWLDTYGAVDRTPDVIWSALADDRGGAWSSLAGMGLVLLYPLLALLLAHRIRHPWLDARRPRAAVMVLLLVLPTALWNWIPGGGQRKNKVRPALLLVTRELSRPAAEQQDPARVARAITVYQTHASALEGDSGWRFVGGEYPLRKRYVGPEQPAPTAQPNVIVLQLETFRAKDMRSMNPTLPGPAPTPFLDALASHPESTYFQRYYASGVPTVHAFMALNASLLMHPTRSVPAEATTDHIESFASLLRTHGYRTLHFTGSDPDWDSQRVWLDRWYDEVHFEPADRERDRDTFRRASARIREVARSRQPFLAYLSSISNHTPFHNPEPALSVSDGDSTVDALHNTMRYTDDVVRELYESLRDEPWFANTVWIVVGDHGFDLGDRGESGGHDNLRHETTWVPLIVHGPARAMPAGARPCVASHLDIAPTILALTGIRDDNSFMGHALTRRSCEGGEALVMRGENFAYETRDYSLFRSADGHAFAYAGEDLTQVRALDAVPAGLLQRGLELSRAYSDVLRYAVDRDLVAPRAQAGGSPLAQASQPTDAFETAIGSE